MTTDPAALPETPPAFATALFGHTAREDLTRYEPRALAWLAERAWQHLIEPRRPGLPSIQVFDPESQNERLAAITVIEVVNDDRPFLLDSTLAFLVEERLGLCLVAHPVLPVGRRVSGEFIDTDLGAHNLSRSGRESLIHIHIDRIAPGRQAEIAHALEGIYGDVRVAVDDWPAMQATVREARAHFGSPHVPLRVDEAAESSAFLTWLLADNFTFLGAREYQLHEQPTASPSFEPVHGSGLGLLRDPNVMVLRRGRELVALTPEVLDFLHEPQGLIIAKANVRSTVHRRQHLDYIGIKVFSEDGQLSGELRLVGLFTAPAYTSPVRSLPVVRRKIAAVLDQAAIDPTSYSGRAMLAVLETYPRDELFQIDVGTLVHFAGEIAALNERPRLRVLARVDRFDRFVSVLCFVPRERYDTGVRLRIGETLADLYGGHVSLAQPSYPEGPLTRTHYIIGRSGGATPALTQDELETAVAAIVRTWDDQLAELLPAGSPHKIDPRFGFPAAYRDSVAPAEAVADLGPLAHLSEERPRVVVLRASADDRSHLKVFSRGRPLPLSERVPVLETFGFSVVSEQTFEIASEPAVWLHNMALGPTPAGAVVDRAPLLEAAIAAVFRGDSESDPFNGLVATAGLGWRDVSLLRALGRYLRQAGLPFAPSYIGQTLVANADLARALVALFYARFDPRLAAEEHETREAEQTQTIEEGLRAVGSLDEDRVIRRLRNLIAAALRTNFFQIGPDGLALPTLAIKFASRSIDDLPRPRPLYEIAVYSPRIEGIHLRFGKVARGGIRWTDRPQDFRTEILGLVKAQQVKNAVIVPVGAKGGFFPKRLPPPSDRDAFLAEGVAAYRDFIGALLDVTDNLVAGAVVPPTETVRHDGDDPYLVVAADKGTATFSDIANAIAVDRKFWLGDAFASGGSAGYDHKKMGITARGAWESVKRHFAEMDIDVQTTPFTVVGVGDMSGDVFGNGMLLSPAIKLIAAFDHRDIFLDPTPDPAASLAERRRLFDKPRSSWKDYDTGLISEGGGVFSRAAKTIALAPATRTVLGLDREQATPDEVMAAILRAPVDLLWFGGIGTYIRASTETDEQAGDRSNDPVRIVANEVRARVIGEGANLGMTQRARIEAALKGVRLNTDAIDNSAGVNTSDLEVNIKIALAQPVAEGQLDEPGRLALLSAMTDDVAALVLGNNKRQTLCLSLAEKRGVDDLGFAARLMQMLERQGRLDRAVEFLPDDAVIEARRRAGQGLTRPELAVLLAYSKLALHDALLDSPVPDEPALESELFASFPAALVERFPQAIRTHRLRRDIIATRLANAIINRGGPTVTTRLADEAGAGAPALARAFVVVRDAFSLDALSGAIDALGSRVAGATQLDLHAAVADLLVSRLVWFIRNVDLDGDLLALGARFREGVAVVAAAIDTVVPPVAREAILRRTALFGVAGVPADLAARLSALNEIAAAPDIVLVAERTGRDLRDVAATFFAADDAFGLGALGGLGRGVPASDYYDRLALNRAIDAIDAARRRLTADILAKQPGAGLEAVQAWIATRGAAAAHVRDTVAAIAGSGLSVSKMTVAASLIGDLARD